jgi:rod shape-determining protein MreC
LREPYKKYRPILLGLALLLAALLLYSLNLRQKESTSLFEQAVITVTSPLQKGFDLAAEQVADWWNHYVWLVDAARENEALRAENRLLKGEIDDLREIRLANERLRKLLEFKDEVALSALPARVIGFDASTWSRTVVLDKGGRSGIKEGMPVVTNAGVVGRVIKVAPGQSRVLLVTDAASAGAVLVQRTRTRAVCRGRGDTLILDFALRQEDVQVGDRVVTSGTGGIFPKGLLMGSVVKVARGDYGLFQSVEVEPAVDFSRLEEVLILTEESQ